jgi:hypothetical protein
MNVRDNGNLPAGSPVDYGSGLGSNRQSQATSKSPGLRTAILPGPAAQIVGNSHSRDPSVERPRVRRRPENVEVQPADRLGIQLAGTGFAHLHLEVARPGRGADSAHAIHHVLQDCLYSVDQFAWKSLEETAQRIADLGKVNLRRYEADNFQGNDEVEDRLRHVHWTILGTEKSRLLALVHLSARAAGTSTGKWLVLDAGYPGTPAQALAFGSPRQALRHVARGDGGRIRMFYPDARIEAPLGARGAYVGTEGYVPYALMSLDELCLLAQRDPNPLKPDAWMTSSSSPKGVAIDGQTASMPTS